MMPRMIRSGIGAALDLVESWEARSGRAPRGAAGRPRPLGGRVGGVRAPDGGGNYPFFHPRYAGQMLKPPHPAAAAGYVAAMLVNPNNHALDGGPATSEMEKEVVPSWPRCSGWPSRASGT